MPPKAKPKTPPAKDGAKAAAKKAKGETGKGAKEDESNPSTSGAEDLAVKLAEAQKQTDREREERSFVQLERDRIISFWEVTKGQLEDACADSRQKDREADHLTEVHQVELKAFKQKIKHLLYEHGLHIEALKADREDVLKGATDEFRVKEGELSADKRSLESQLREQEDGFEHAAQAARIESAKRESKLRAQLAQEAKALSDKNEAQLSSVREAAEIQRKQEQHAIEERKNSHIQALMQQHEKAFSDMKNYFNGVVRDNLDAIMALKAELAEHKRRETTTQSLLQEVVAENKRLSEPLDKAQAEVEELKKAASSHDRERASLAMARTRLSQATTDLDRLRFENEVWQQRLECEESERLQLQTQFDQTVASMQQSAAATTLLLQKHAGTMMTSALDLEASGDTENRPAGQMLEASGKSGLVGLTTSKSTLGLGNRSGSRGLKPHNETVRLGSPERKIGALHAQRSRSDSKACLDDLCIEGVGPPMALVHI